MNPKRKLLALMFALPLVSSMALADPAEEATQLEPLTVTAPVDPLYASDRLLRVMLERSLPCLGCDAVLVSPRRGAAASLLRHLLLPAVPPEPSEVERLAFEQKVHDAPDLEYLRP